MDKPALLLASSILFAPLLWGAELDSDEVIDLPGLSFKYSIETSAQESTIWRLWTDVKNWKKFDTLLEYSYLDEGITFGEGAIGYLKAEGAPRTTFEIINVNGTESFTVHLRLPLYQTINQHRYFENNNSGGTTFTHEVSFKGALSPLLPPRKPDP